MLATLARQAGLAIANARLAEELGTRLKELRASRARIVEAEERARRRIERDIHDGSQQEIAALIARIGLARNQLRRDPSLAIETLADVQSEAQQALENLRQLASGIHPSVLTDRGIVEAIEARGARLPLDVMLESDPDLRTTRFDETVEGGVWFVVSECFANTLKHSRAQRVVVRITRTDRQLSVEVSDDGIGFDPAAADPGGGLAGLGDRIAALGGALDVESAPGAGTRVRATLPARERSLA
ncbi:MAG: histidine kinase [Actinomycetota bacterium]|nr:histidine kinase [Actinomycetota bacterium]